MTAAVAPMDWITTFTPGRLDWRPAALPKATADRWFESLRSEIDWRQETLTLFGQPRKVPRLIAWYGDPDATYRYSGVDHQPLAWTPLLTEIRRWISGAVGHDFNGVLLNLYRNGQDGMGWHADDEPELGTEPVLASLSLGATRRMRFRRRDGQRVSHGLDLGHGSLLVMSGATQAHWQHQIPKTRRPVEARINLTFRRIHTTTF